MTILVGSRYEFDRIGFPPFLGSNGQVCTSSKPTIFPSTAGQRHGSHAVSFVDYIATQGTRLDVLAFRIYGKAILWWLIADANPEIMYPEDLLTPGQQIRIPIFDFTNDQVLPASPATGNGVVTYPSALSGVL